VIPKRDKGVSPGESGGGRQAGVRSGGHSTLLCKV
jgi:hypothetical protein